MVRLQRLTGMRPAETCLLRPADIDRSGDVWIYRPTSHKTQHAGKERIISLGPKAQRILICYLARDSEMFCFRPCDSEHKRRAERNAARCTPLSSGNGPGSSRILKPKREPGDQYSSASYRRAIGRACDRAFPHPTLSQVSTAQLNRQELQDLRTWQQSHRWSPNQLRHSAATDIRRRFGLEAAQVVLGRSGVTQVYAERYFGLAAKVTRHCD